MLIFILLARITLVLFFSFSNCQPLSLLAGLSVSFSMALLSRVLGALTFFTHSLWFEPKCNNHNLVNPENISSLVGQLVQFLHLFLHFFDFLG